MSDKVKCNRAEVCGVTGCHHYHEHFNGIMCDQSCPENPAAKCLSSLSSLSRNGFNDYTVIIISYKYYSFFVGYVSAESMIEDGRLGVDRAEGETGISDYECSTIFEGCVKQPCESLNKIFDWR